MEDVTDVAGPGRRWVDAERFDALQTEVRRLRLQVAEEVRTRRVVVVDRAGFCRIRLSADDDACRLQLLDRDGFDRIALTAHPEIGTVTVAARTAKEPIRVDVFALDAEQGEDVPTAGVELIGDGNSVGGLTVRSGRTATVWTEPLV